MGTPSVSSGLVGHWKLNGDATDSSGNGYNGTANGGFSYATDSPSAISGEISQCPDLDGVNDYVIASVTTDNWSAISVSFWLKTSSNLTNKYLISLPEVSSGGNGFDFRATSTSQVANYTNATTMDRDYTASLTYGTGSWIHIVFSYDSAAASSDRNQIWINGSRATSVIGASGNIETAAGEVNIGRFGSFGAYSQMRVSDVRLYSRQLTSGEVGTIYGGDYTGGSSIPVFINHYRQQGFM